MPTVTPQPQPKPLVNIANFPEKVPGGRGYLECVEENKHLHVTCVIDDFVDATDNYLELQHLLFNAKEDDVFDIIIYSYGGWVESGIELIHAFANTKGKVTTTVYGMCASIAAVIWCCGHVRRIAPSGVVMFHMPSGRNFGKTADIEEETHQIQEYFSYLLAKITKGILTKEQIQRIVVNRRDTYITADKLADVPGVELISKEEQA